MHLLGTNNMTPLEANGKVYQDNEEKALNWWKNLFGISSDNAILAAAHNMGLTPKKGNIYKTGLPLRLLAIQHFPAILRGLQESIRPTDNYIFHPWSQGIDTNADTITLLNKNGKQLVFKK